MTTPSETDDRDLILLRHRMVEEQLRRRGIADPRVLSAMESVPRHRFVGENARWAAYEDEPLAIGLGQTISQPYMVARMTELLNLDVGSRVLEVGTGSGYQAAVLAEVAAEVWTIERHPQLADRARRVLAALGYRNVHVVLGDGSLGLPEHAPYDAIIVTAAAPRMPALLLEQLAPAGRLVIPVGGRDLQQLRLIRRRDGGFTESDILGCRFVPLVGGVAVDGREAATEVGPAPAAGAASAAAAHAAAGGATAEVPAAAAAHAHAGLRRVHVVVEGRVQGVWFRDSTREEARRLGVAGWVRNLSGGRVEAIFEGPPTAVSALLAWTEHGPEHAVVTHLQVREETPEGERGFRIRG